MRTAINKWHVEEKGFKIIAVVGDWPDCTGSTGISKYLDDRDKNPLQMLGHFRRSPTWIWANREVAAD